MMTRWDFVIVMWYYSIYLCIYISNEITSLNILTEVPNHTDTKSQLMSHNSPVLDLIFLMIIHKAFIRNKVK